MIWITLEYGKKFQEYADFQISNKLVKEQYKVKLLEKRINILKKKMINLLKPIGAMSQLIMN